MVFFPCLYVYVPYVPFGPLPLPMFLSVGKNKNPQTSHSRIMKAYTQNLI